MEPYTQALPQLQASIKTSDPRSQGVLLKESKALGKHGSRRSGTRILLVVGWRHVPPTWDLERRIFVCRSIVDATRTKQARVQKREYPAGGLNSLGQIILVNSVVTSYYNITTTEYSEPAG